MNFSWYSNSGHGPNYPRLRSPTAAREGEARAGAGSDRRRPETSCHPRERSRGAAARFRFRCRGEEFFPRPRLPELRAKITEKENLILSVPGAPLRAVVYSSRIERGARRDQENPNHVVNPIYSLFDSTGLFSSRQEGRRTNKIRSLSGKSIMAAAGAALLRSVATKMARTPPRLPSALERHRRLSTSSRFSTSTGSTPQPANQVCC